MAGPLPREPRGEGPVYRRQAAARNRLGNTRKKSRSVHIEYMNFIYTASIGGSPLSF